ncbi:MAG: hypothetical protein KA521_00235 [Crocinitomicaceae bacterium]|nr:hypothetical protein [Crocinitomicaceae bacterium]
MKNTLRYSFFASLLITLLFVTSSCENTDPSVMKIFVRSQSNELLKDAEVIIIGDVNSNPATLPYVDTLFTNSSGYAQFNLDSYYSKAGEGNEVAYFDVIAKKNTKQATAYVRCRMHITAVETIFILN